MTGLDWVPSRDALLVPGQAHLVEAVRHDRRADRKQREAAGASVRDAARKADRGIPARRWPVLYCWHVVDGLRARARTECNASTLAHVPSAQPLRPHAVTQKLHEQQGASCIYLQASPAALRQLCFVRREHISVSKRTDSKQCAPHNWQFKLGLSSTMPSADSVGRLVAGAHLHAWIPSPKCLCHGASLPPALVALL